MALSHRDRRVLTVAAGVLGGVLALLVVITLVGREPEPTTKALPRPTTPQPASTTSPSPEREFRVGSDRDPFSPPAALATQAATTAETAAAAPDQARAGAPATTGVSSTPSSTVPGFAPPSTTTPPTTPPPPPPPSCQGERRTLCEEVGDHVVRLIRVFRVHHNLRADIKVDRKGYQNLRDGDRFAHRFKLVGFNEENCARVVFRASGFTFCE